MPQPQSHWIHMAPIKAMFHQRSLFHSYSLLRLRNCSFSIGRVWIQDLVEALITTGSLVQEEFSYTVVPPPKSLHMSQLQDLWVGAKRNLGSN